MKTLASRLVDYVAEGETIHQILTERLNLLDPRLLRGDVRRNKVTGRVKFFEWELMSTTIHFTDYPAWDGDSGADFEVDQSVLFDQAAADAASKALDEAEAKAKEDEAAAILQREAANREKRRQDYLKLKEEFGEEEG